jgi:peptidoglycan/LPS O-acetylase OafA/YrhL
VAIRKSAQTHTSRRIEALRAVAALSVVGYHIQVVTHGYDGNWAALPAAARVAMFGSFGVNVFFALSGYLLFRPFVRAACGAGSIDVARYAINRAVRILPLYYVAVVLLLATQPGGASWDQVWRHLLFAQNLSTGTRLVDGPLWSLVCEVEFYALLPLLAWVILRSAGGKPGRALVNTCLFALGALLLESVTWGASPSTVWNFSLPANLVAFAPGMLIAALQVELLRHPRVQLRSRIGMSALALAAAGTWIAMYPGPTRLGVVLASGLTLAAVVSADHALPPSRRRVAPLAAIGIASYSLYVWHLPLIDHLAALRVLGSNTLVNVLIVVPLCVALAAVSYRCVELPFLRLRRRWAGTRASAPVEEASAPALLAPI